MNRASFTILPLLACIASAEVPLGVAGGDAPRSLSWIPFAVEQDIEPGSALDFSWIAASHAPCGVHGRIVARGGHFEFENRPGEPVRFWGVNISSGANFPDEEKADSIAAHLAALGYNAVRIHHHDGGLVGQNPDAFAKAGGSGDGRSPVGRGLDPDALRRHDALVAACGKYGLYIITDIYVSRPVSWRACGIDRDGTMGKGQFKHLVPVHDGAFANWCAFASAWLGHTNAFTGVRFADDPALIAVALINEGNLDNGAGPEPFVSLPNWQEKWEAWLAEKKREWGAARSLSRQDGNTRTDTTQETAARASGATTTQETAARASGAAAAQETAARASGAAAAQETAAQETAARASGATATQETARPAARASGATAAQETARPAARASGAAAALADYSDIPATIPKGDHWQRTRHVAAFSRFLTDVEADFEARAVRFLREEIGLKAPISNMSAWMQPPEYQSILAGPTQDYVEAHSYCDHPTFPERQWGLPCRVGRENPVRQRSHSMGHGAMGATLKRIFGKPFCVTEFNYVAPNPHRGAGGLLFGAEAAAQDWSGAWRFDWASSKSGIERPGTGYCGLFAFNCDPLRQASDRLAQMLFLRGDLAPCADAYAVWLPPSKITGTFDGESRQLNTPWPELTWRARLGTVWSEEPPTWARWVDSYPDYYKRRLPVPDDIPQRAAPVASDIPPRGDIALDPVAGWFTVATPRTCAIFAEGGEHEAGALKVTLSGGTGSAAQDSNQSVVGAAPSAPASATIWASSLDGEPLTRSRHILMGMLTDLRNTGMETEDGGVGTSSLSGGPTILVRKWGGLPYLVRSGAAQIELATAPGEWKAWALSQGGRRIAAIPLSRTGSERLSLTLETAALPDAATLFWELER